MSTITVPKKLDEFASDFIGQSYADMNCWELVRRLYRRGLGIDIPLSQQMAARDFAEMWYRESRDDEVPQELPQPWDLMLMEVRQESGPHVGIVIPGGRIMHSTLREGVHTDSLHRWAPYLLQLSRPQVLLRDHLPKVPANTPLIRSANEVLIRWVRSPLPSQHGALRETYTYEVPGQTISQLVPRRQEEYSIWHNGKRLESSEYGITIPDAGDELLVSSYWGDPVTAIFAFAQIVLSLGLIVLSKTLLAPQLKSVDDEQAERTATFAGIQSTDRPGGPLPIILGRHRIGPTLLFANATYDATFIDSAQAPPSESRTIVATLGGHDHQTGRPGQPVQIVLDAVVDWKAGQAIKIISSLSQTSRGTFIIERNRVVARTGIQVSLIELSNSRNITTSGFDNGTAIRENILSVAATSASARINLLYAVCEGPIEDIHLNTIEINGQPIDNFPEAITDKRLGFANQSPIVNANATRTSFTVGSDIDKSPSLTYTTTTGVNGFSFNIDFNQGLMRFGENGARLSNQVRVAYRFQRDGGTFGAERTIAIPGKSLSPVRVSIEIRDLALGVYTTEIRLVDADDESASFARFQPTLSTVTEIINSSEPYNGTALLYVSGILADRLPIGGARNVTVIVEGEPVRVASFTAAPRFSNNPAWMTMHMLTKYFGRPDSEIDLPAFQAWANKNDELVDSVSIASAEIFNLEEFNIARSGKRKRHTHNLALERITREQTVLSELALPSRAELLETEGRVSPRLLTDTIPAQLFTSANVLNLVVTSLLDQDRIQVIQVQFNNEQNNFDRETFTWPGVDDWPASPNILEIDLRGVTHPEEVQFFAQWELARRQLPTDVIRFETPEAPRLQRYDLFNFAHDQQGWGESGRTPLMPASTLSTLQLDRSVNYTLVDDPYHVYIRHTDGTIDIREVVNQGSDTTLTALPLTTPMSQIPDPETTIWAYGEVLTSGGEDGATLIFRCLDISFNTESGRYVIEALEHVPATLTDPTPIPPSTITVLPRVTDEPPPISNLAATSFKTAKQGTLSGVQVLLSWSFDRGIEAINPRLAIYGGALIQRRQIFSASTLGSGQLDAATLDGVIDPSEVAIDDHFATIGEATNGAMTFDDLDVFPGDSFIYKVIPLSTTRTFGQPAYVNHHVPGTINGPGDTVPEMPANLRLEGQTVGVTAFEGPDIIFEVDPPSNGIFGTGGFPRDWCWEIWGTDDQSNLAYRIHPRVGVNSLACTIEPRLHYRQQLNTEDALAAGQAGPLRKVTARVWARAFDGVRSNTPAQLTVDNVAPDMSSTLPLVNSLIDGLSVSWESFAAPRDIDKYRVVVDDRNPPRLDGTAIIDSFIAGSNNRLSVDSIDSSKTHFVQVIPHDTFGAGISSQVVSQKPAVPASQWSFFVSRFASPDIVFTPSDPSVSWSSGTLNYQDETGVAKSQPISADIGTRLVNQSLFVYYVLGESIFRTTQVTTDVFKNDRVVIAVYNGGSAVEEVYGAKLSGTDLIAETVGAAQLVTNAAVITGQAQVASAVIGEAQIQDAAITSVKIQDAAIDNAKIGDLQVDTIKIANNSITQRFVVDSDIGEGVGTTELILASIDVFVVENLGTVLLTSSCYIATLQNTEQFILRIREDGLLGNEIGRSQARNLSSGGFLTFPMSIITSHIPSVTSTKTFVLTGVMETNVDGVTVHDIHFNGIYIQK